MSNSTPVAQRIDWRHQYDYVRDAEERASSDSINNEPSMTQLHHAEDNDLNVIMKRYGITDGALPPMALDPKYFGEFDSELDLSEVFRRQREAVERFDAMPATLRNKFHNNPAELFHWIHQAENEQEGYDLGIFKRPTPPVNKQDDVVVLPPAKTP